MKLWNHNRRQKILGSSIVNNPMENKKIYDIHRMKVSKRFLFGGIAFIGTMIGRNSNIVFLLHIPFTLLFIKLLEGKKVVYLLQLFIHWLYVLF